MIYPTFSKEFRYDSPSTGSGQASRVSDEIYTLSSGETISVSNNYDQFGRLQSTSGPGGTTTYHYDLLGRKIQVDDPSNSTRFGHDAWGNLEYLTDAANQRTDFPYDSSGRLTQELRPMQQSTAMSTTVRVVCGKSLTRSIKVPNTDTIIRDDWRRALTPMAAASH